MINKIKKSDTIVSKLILSSLVLIFAFSTLSLVISPVNAASNTEDINSPTFKLSVCDGPEGLRNQYATTSKEYREFVPCNFAGMMKLVQHAINIMITLGIIGALLGFSFAGYLYITGVPGNITRSHEIFKKVGIGLLLMLSAWAIVYQLLTWLSKNDAGKALLN